MSTEFNLCPKCGGLKDPIPVAYPRAFGLCSCKPATKHDGRLGEEAYVEYRHYPKNIASPNMMVRVSAECGELTPTEALSLLDWLTREKVTLEQLAKDQVHE